MAMRLDLEPFVGAGKLHFGMSKAEAGEVIESDGLTWTRAGFGASDSDFPARFIIDNEFVHLGFDGTGILETLEFSFGSSPLFKGKNLMETPFLDFVRIINGVGRARWLWSSGGVLSVDFGIVFSNDDLFYTEDQGDNEYGDFPRIISLLSRRSTLEYLKDAEARFQSLAAELSKEQT